MREQRLLLIGPPASGKSTFGAQWAEQLGIPFWDTDQEVVRRTNRSISEWFAEGEEAFRQAEWQTVRALLQEGQTGIIAIGGGFPAQAGAISFLRQSGYLLWIDPPTEWLIERWQSCKETRPLLARGSLPDWLHLLEQRRPFYRQADLHWQPHRIPESFILQWIQRRLFISSVEVLASPLL
ncbi:MAG: shikimate kinase [Bacteroidia bacterium]|nr:shikimate kinase [Bacteroidia bacterium]